MCLNSKFFYRLALYGIYTVLFSLPIGSALLEVSVVCTLLLWLSGWALEFYENIKHKDKLRNVWRNLREVFLSTPLHCLILVFFAWNIGHVYFSIDPLSSLGALFTKFIESLLLFWICFDLCRRNNKTHFMLIGTIILGIISVDGIWQLVTGSDFLRGRELSGIGHLEQIQASFKNPNTLAGWFLLMIWFPFGYWNYKQKKSLLTKLALLGVICFSSYCLLGTNSRGAWLAFFMASFCGVLTYLACFTYKRQCFIRIVYLLLFMLLCICVYAYVLNRFNNLLIFNSVTFRFDLWRKAWWIAREFNFLGCGLNTYTVIAKQYTVFTDSSFYPHNGLLHMLVEIGLPGVILFMSIVSVALYMALLRIIRCKDFKFLAISTSVLAFFLHVFLDTIYRQMQLFFLFWLLLGFLIAELHKSEGNENV